MLADRLAAWILDHDPGWRLPRRGHLARRYDAAADEMDVAIASLAARGIVRELADGQVYRASPAEYLITLDRLALLAGFRIDPMGTTLACATRNILHRAVPRTSCTRWGSSRVPRPAPSSRRGRPAG